MRIVFISGCEHFDGITLGKKQLFVSSPQSIIPVAQHCNQTGRAVGDDIGEVVTMVENSLGATQLLVELQGCGWAEGHEL